MNDSLTVYGGMAEWFIAAVLKTAGGKTSVGSNPTPVATRLCRGVLCRMAVVHSVTPFRQGRQTHAAPSNAAWETKRSQARANAERTKF